MHVSDACIVRIDSTVPAVHRELYAFSVTSPDDDAAASAGRWHRPPDANFAGPDEAYGQVYAEAGDERWRRREVVPARRLAHRHEERAQGVSLSACFVSLLVSLLVSLPACRLAC